MADRTATLVVKVVTDAKEAAAGLEEAGGKTGKFQRGLAVASKASAVALAAVGAAAVKAGQAAAEDAQSQAVLAKAMENSAGASKGQIAAMEDYISKASAASGVADDQLRPAMGNLLRATGDAEKSQKAMNAALDISAATGADVGAVSKALAKGYAGNAGGLKKLVPSLSDAAVKSGNMDRIMRELAKTTGGASAAAANTAAGKMKRFQLAMDETQEAAGGALLPIMDKLSGVLLTVATWAQKNSTLFVALVGAIGAVAAAVLVVNAVTKVYTATMIVMNAVQKATWLTNPIALAIAAVIAAVIALVAAIVILWKRSATFRRIVLATWAAIKAGARAVTSFLKSAFRAAWAVLSAYVRAYLTVVRAVWSAVKAAAGTLLSWLKTAWRAVWSTLKTVARTYIAAVRAVWDAIKSAAQTVTGWLKTAWGTVWDDLKAGVRGVGAVLAAPFNVAKAAIDPVIAAVRSLIDWLGRIKVPKISLPSLGGLNPFSRSASPQVATAGPAGFSAATYAAAGTPTTRGAGGGITINVTGALDPEATARQIQRILTGHNRRVGLVSA